MSAPSRSRRERPAKSALSRDAIVEAALAITREEGLDSVSMRRIAQALDTGPASLYVYVANREELHELLFDAAIATIETEPVDPKRWREQLKALGHRMVRMMVEDYPGIAILAMTHIPVGDNALRLTESMLALLQAGGASDQAAAYAADLLSMYVTAIAFEQSLYATRYSDPGHEMDEVEKIARRFATLDAGRYPTMAAIAPFMTRGDGDERFELGMDVLINGLLATPTEGRLSAGPWAPSS